MELTLKLNKTDISSVIRDLERYEYNVKTPYKEDDPNTDFLERYNQLMRFLNP